MSVCTGIGLNHSVFHPSYDSSLTQVLGLAYGSTSERNWERFNEEPQERGGNQMLEIIAAIGG